MKFFSGEKPTGEKPLNPLKAEHLKEGVSPIIACVGTPDQFSKNDSSKEDDDPQYEVVPNPASDTNDNRRNRNVDYLGNPQELSKLNFKNAGWKSYVISPIDSLDKFSESFVNCTGLIVAGIDKETGESVSFLSHEDPDYFLKDTKATEKFANDLRERLEAIKKRCEEGTVDAVIVGGNYFTERPQFQRAYKESIELLSEEVQEVLGFEPVAITGPKTVPGRDHVFYDNGHRRLYIMRPRVAQEGTKSYLPSEIDGKEKGWNKDDTEKVVDF